MSIIKDMDIYSSVNVKSIVICSGILSLCYILKNNENNEIVDINNCAWICIKQFSKCQLFVKNHFYKPFYKYIYTPLYQYYFNKSILVIHKENVVQSFRDMHDFKNNFDIYLDDKIDWDFMLFFVNNREKVLINYDMNIKMDYEPIMLDNYICGQINIMGKCDNLNIDICFEMENLNKFNVKDNKLFKDDFVKWYCKTYHNHEIHDESYTIMLMDNNCNQIILKKGEYEYLMNNKIVTSENKDECCENQESEIIDNITVNSSWHWLKLG